jgi:hypothetical protein
VIEFSWQQIKDYCAKYNLEHVKELYFGKFSDLLNLPDRVWVPIEEYRLMALNYLQNAFSLESKCTHCSTGVPAEGITVRIDGKSKFLTYKLKSKLFLKKESDDLDKGETNIEDNA